MSSCIHVEMESGQESALSDVGALSLSLSMSSNVAFTV